MEYETTLPGVGVAFAPLLAGELLIDTAPSPLPDLELEASAPANASRKKSVMYRRSELPLMGNDIQLSAIREVKLLEPVQTALEVDMSPPVPSRRRQQPLVVEPLARPARSVLTGLGKPVRLIVLAVLLMIGDFLYLSLSGEPISVGPARVFWVAGPLAGVGLIWLFQILLSGEA
jgi:hypothetical protein